ncbi:hypothetical protein LIER_24394 [Lithospermum erythrorhizon]|uniref:Reverse transcriptase zinc-binding domain-containing protein n=1 Tax=Lithospermum erythrorhizon TaxID=34254 RepID=A0AAV3R489_LITER
MERWGSLTLLLMLISCFSPGRDISSVGIFLDCLSHLERCSGLAVSPAKSSVYLGGVRGPKRDAILARVHGNYLKGVSIWDYVKRRKDSLLMRSLCDLRDTLVAVYGGRAEAIVGLEGYCVGGKLVSKLVYEKLQTPRVKRPWMSAIWNGFIPPKYSFVVWLACRDRGVSSFGCILSRVVLSGSGLLASWGRENPKGASIALYTDTDSVLLFYLGVLLSGFGFCLVGLVDTLLPSSLLSVSVDLRFDIT